MSSLLFTLIRLEKQREKKEKRKPKTLKTANICTLEFRDSNVFFCGCGYRDRWAREKEILYESSVCFSLENVSVTFKLNAKDKNKVEKKFF